MVGLSQVALLGVLILDTRFPRIPGDPGNIDTYDFPVKFKVVEGARVPRVVRPHIDRELLPLFIEGGRELKRDGATAITTSCGFLSVFQSELGRALEVPVFTSTLMLIPLAYRAVEMPIGVITADSSALTQEHFEGAGVSRSTPLTVKGMEDKKEFRTVILEDGQTINSREIENELLETCEGCLEDQPETGAFVFECTNLAPYSHSIQRKLGKPIFDYVMLSRLAYWSSSKMDFASKQEPSITTEKSL